MGNILHGVGIPQTVLVAVVEVLHLGERLEAEVEDRERGTGRLGRSLLWPVSAPALVGGSGLHHCDCWAEGVTLTVIIIGW